MENNLSDINNIQITFKDYNSEFIKNYSNLIIYLNNCSIDFPCKTNINVYSNTEDIELSQTK